MKDTGIDYMKNGRGYPVTVDAWGQLYIYDPRRELKHERDSIKGYYAGSAPGLGRVKGLGVVPQSAFQIASSAADFIPVVGPFLSAAISAAGALFGGGDPTALSTLIGQIVGLRQTIAAANRQLGIVDAFVVPAGFDPKNKDAWRNFVDAIVEEALGVTEAQIQSNRRPDYYAAIAALQKTLNAALQQIHDQTLIAQIEAQNAGGGAGAIGNPSPGTPAPAGTAGTAGTAGAQGIGTVPAATSSADNSSLLMVAALAAGAYFLLDGKRH